MRVWDINLKILKIAICNIFFSIHKCHESEIVMIMMIPFIWLNFFFIRTFKWIHIRFKNKANLEIVLYASHTRWKINNTHHLLPRWNVYDDNVLVLNGGRVKKNLHNNKFFSPYKLFPFSLGNFVCGKHHFRVKVKSLNIYSCNMDIHATANCYCSEGKLEKIKFIMPDWMHHCYDEMFT